MPTFSAFTRTRFSSAPLYLRILLLINLFALTITLIILVFSTDILPNRGQRERFHLVSWALVPALCLGIGLMVWSTVRTNRKQRKIGAATSRGWSILEHGAQTKRAWGRSGSHSGSRSGSRSTNSPDSENDNSQAIELQYLTTQLRLTHSHAIGIARPEANAQGRCHVGRYPSLNTIPPFHSTTQTWGSYIEGVPDGYMTPLSPTSTLTSEYYRNTGIGYPLRPTYSTLTPQSLSRAGLHPVLTRNTYSSEFSTSSPSPLSFMERAASVYSLEQTQVQSQNWSRGDDHNHDGDEGEDEDEEDGKRTRGRKNKDLESTYSYMWRDSWGTLKAPRPPFLRG